MTNIPKLRQRIIARDNHECQHCHKGTDLQVHHKVPKSSGGKSTEDNLVTLCKICHRNWHKIERIAKALALRSRNKDSYLMEKISSLI